MEEIEISKYLANILTVARCDGIISPEEEIALQQIQNEIGAKKKVTTDAVKLVERQDYQPIPVGRYSNQISNLEDMVFVALADGELADSERDAILSFAKQIGVTQEQLKLIVSESRSRAKAQEGLKKCPNCHLDISSSAKFCPECGAAIESKDESAGISVAFKYPTEGISIEFAESTSANFDAALREASTAPNFQECMRGNKKWFLATWQSNQMLNVVKLVQNLKGIRNRKAYLDGNEIAWDELFGFLWCMEQRQSAYRPAEYCFGADDKQLNVWGCKQIRMDWTDWEEWFSYGHFRKRDVFVFDKERISHELKNNIHKFRFCPFLRKKLIEVVFQLLPDEVKVSKQTGWNYKENYQETPNSIKIVVQEQYEGFTTTNEFYTDGVMPIGFEVAKNILKKAFKQCGTNDVDLKVIIP